MVHSPASGPSTPTPSWDPEERAGPVEAATEAGTAGSADHHPFPALGWVADRAEAHRSLKRAEGSPSLLSAHLRRAALEAATELLSPAHSWRGRNSRALMTSTAKGVGSPAPAQEMPPSWAVIGPAPAIDARCTAFWVM